MISAVTNQKIKKRSKPFKVGFQNKDKIDLLQKKTSPRRRSLLHLALDVRSGGENGRPDPSKDKELPSWVLIFGAVLLALSLSALIIVKTEILEKVGIIPSGQGGASIEPISLAHDEAFDEFLYNYLISEDVRIRPEGGDLSSELIRSLEISDYVLKKGDSLSGISSKFKLNMDTIISYNNIKRAKNLTPGMKLKIPSVDGVKYRVRRGDTLSGIASKHGISLNSLLDWNNITDSLIMIGTEYFIPGGRLSKNDLNRVLGRLFLFPTQGRLTSLFGWRKDPINGKDRYHNGIDIANVQGTGVKSAMDGTVIKVGFSSGYGKYVIVKHDEGFQTLYGH